MKHSTKALLTAALVTAASGGASALNVTMGWDAATYDNDGSWEVNEVDGSIAGGSTIRWNGGTTDVLVNGATTNFTNITDYVSTPNFVLNRATGGGESWQDILGDPASDADSSWEFVFSPGDFTGTEPIFDTGGTGDGTGLRMIGSTLNFRFQDGSGAGQFLELTSDLSAIGSATDFYHVVAVADLGNATSASALYVNGLLVASGGDTSAINDWDGGDDAGLGRVGGTSPQIGGAAAVFDNNFDGDVAIMRSYQGQLVNSTDARNLFAATTGNRNIATMGWDAADYDGDGTWETSESDPSVTGAAGVTWHGPGTKQTGSTNFANINAWVNSPNFIQGTTSGTAAGDDDFNSTLSPDITTKDATWEFVLRPGDYAGRHLIIEHGGNVNGLTIELNGSTLTFVAQSGSTSLQQVFDVDLSAIDTADQFFHIIATTEVGTTGNADGLSGLYVNGVLVDNTDNTGGVDTLADWSGTDGGGLGRKTGTSAFGDATYSAFNGDIAIARIYADQAFDQTAVDAAFAAVPEPSSLALLGLGGLALMRRRRGA